MLNQTSFRLASSLTPTSTTGKVTQVINKKNNNWDNYYPSFINETVVLTNEYGSVIETTKATCDGSWNITFTARGLSDDYTETSVASKILSWNPWTICFVTAWAWDLVTRAEYNALEDRVSALESLIPNANANLDS